MLSCQTIDQPRRQTTRLDTLGPEPVWHAHGPSNPVDEAAHRLRLIRARYGHVGRGPNSRHHRDPRARRPATGAASPHQSTRDTVRRSVRWPVCCAGRADAGDAEPALPHCARRRARCLARRTRSLCHLTRLRAPRPTSANVVLTARARGTAHGDTTPMPGCDSAATGLDGRPGARNSLRDDLPSPASTRSGCRGHLPPLSPFELPRLPPCPRHVERVEPGS